MQANELRRELTLPNVSTSTIQQTLYDKGYGRQRPGWKVPLNADNKAQRVAILKEYHPDKFNWRNVVFTDETPAKVGDRRGMHRSWAKKDEAYHPDVKEARLKRQSEGQVWACFAYGRKGPIKFWYTEEEGEKEAANSALEEEIEVRKAAMVLERMSRLKENNNRKQVKKGKKAKRGHNLQAKCSRPTAASTVIGIEMRYSSFC